MKQFTSSLSLNHRVSVFKAAHVTGTRSSVCHRKREVSDNEHYDVVMLTRFGWFKIEKDIETVVETDDLIPL